MVTKIQPKVAPRMTDKALYGRPMAYDARARGPFGLPYLNNGPTPLADTHVPEWHAFTNTEACFYGRLCMYCGSRMTGPIVHVRVRGDHHVTSGPPGHPTCMLYATRSCPHVTGDPSAGADTDIIAYVTIGEVGADILMNERGWVDIEQTFQEGLNDVVRHAIPITASQLRELAREYPER